MSCVESSTKQVFQSFWGFCLLGLFFLFFLGELLLFLNFSAPLVVFRVAAYAPVEEEQDSDEWSLFKTLQTVLGALE